MRLSVGMAATLPIMAKLKITAAAKTNLEPDMFLAPEIDQQAIHAH
jgi:hypothetical protein